MPGATMAARTQSPRNAPRGPAAQRRGGARTDRDGDLTMGVAVKGAGRIGKSTPTAPSSSRRSGTTRVATGGLPPSRGGSRAAPTGLLSGNARSAILRQAAAGDVSMKEARSRAPRSGLEELVVTGWEKSKASSDADGGVSSLIKWLEKKASNRLGSRTKDVKVKKSRVEGTTLMIGVPPEDVAALVRMSGYGWAGTTVKIERVGGDSNASSTATKNDKEDTRDMLKGVLERRYHADTKLLDLSALGTDPDLQSKGVFSKTSTTSKIFPALMAVLDVCFDNPGDKEAAITSVSLANNDLANLDAVTSLSPTLPKLHNLDLSNNKFDSLSALDNWRRRFYHLKHLILSGNPIEQNQPDYPAEVVKWYPNLRMLNNIQVRTEEEIANKAKVTELPFPIRTPLFRDEGGIAENFVRTFFAGFDGDRAALAAHYYDDQSDFSYAVNTQAPRDPAATEHTEKQEWDQYIKNSRNLKKISHLPARQNRHFRGAKAVTEAFTALPRTKHPDLASEARKWMIETHIQPGVPDPTGQSPNGVDGFMITVHGEFDELDASGQAKKKRSFDRTFIVGPGGPSGVRVVNDMLTIRAYGGAQAFEPDHMEAWNMDVPQGVNNVEVVPELPAGLTVEVAKQMVAELQKQTGMTVQYAKDCLEQSGWDFQKGLEAFATAKANLPREAFVQLA